MKLSSRQGATGPTSKIARAAALLAAALLCISTSSARADDTGKAPGVKPPKAPSRTPSKRPRSLRLKEGGKTDGQPRSEKKPSPEPAEKPTSKPTAKPTTGQSAGRAKSGKTSGATSGRPSGKPGTGGSIEPLSGGELKGPATVKNKKGKTLRLRDVRTEGKRRRPKRALVGLEFVPGVAIPFKNYLDFGKGQNTYFLDNGVGFGFSLALTLDFIELRYSYASLSTGRVKGRLPDDAVDALRLIEQAGGIPAGTIQQDIDIEAPSNLVIHNITFGYRLAFEPHEKFSLVFPFGFGVVIARPPNFGVLSYNLYGFGGFVGVRGELKIAGMFAVGVDTRLSIFVTEPDPNLAAAGYASTESVFDNAVAWLPMLNVALSLRYYY